MIIEPPSPTMPQPGPAPSVAPQRDAFGAPAAGPSPALVRALRRVLRPLIRLMLANGITYTYLADLLKGLFVEVAERDFRLDDKSPTDSRVSLVSGVHRKDVSRLRQVLQSAEVVESSVVPRGAQLVAHWLGNARYLDADGRPRPLARLASEGGDLSFEALVAGVNSDIRSRVVLDEWLRLGVVHLDEAGRVCLNTAAFVPTKGADEKAFYLGHNLGDHAAAAAHNLLGGQPALMERSVHYNALSSGAVQQLSAQAEQLGMQALLAVNQSAMDAEQAEPDGAHRITFGIYFYTEPSPAQGPDTVRGASS